jgi:hypothetical protein
MHASRASAKAAGVVIDDAAVTPRYVVGLAAERELPIIGRIAWGSLKNKLLYLLPGYTRFGYQFTGSEALDQAYVPFFGAFGASWDGNGQPLLVARSTGGWKDSRVLM